MLNNGGVGVDGKFHAGIGEFYSKQIKRGQVVKSKQTKTGSSIITAKPVKNIYERISANVEKTRGNITRAVNTKMLLAYWHMGREIIEEEQRGRARAD